MDKFEVRMECLRLASGCSSMAGTDPENVVERAQQYYSFIFFDGEPGGEFGPVTKTVSQLRKAG